MRVFVTGAAGFIGSVVVKELIDSGHQVIGLARSDANAKALAAAGAQVHRGDLADLESLRKGAAMSDGVVHTAFIHDFAKFQENCEIDRRAIEAIGSALAGSNRPFIVTSGTGLMAPGRVATEADVPDSNFPRKSEQAAVPWAERGVRVIVMRLPQVHDREKQGLVSYAIAIAAEKGVSAYVGEGGNRWPAVHRLDVGRLYRLALEKGTAGARYHGVAEEGVRVRDIAEVIGRRLSVPLVCQTPEQAAAHFGWLARFMGADCPASSAQTQKQLGWHPEQTTSLLADMEPEANLTASVGVAARR